MVVVNQLTFPAGSPKGQSGVNLVLDLNESIEHHRATMVEVHSVLLHTRLVTRLIWILCVMSGGGRERGRERERERCMAEIKSGINLTISGCGHQHLNRSY